MKTDKSFESKFGTGWDEQRKKEKLNFRIRVILLIFALFPFSLILGLVFIL